jgi:hypothetical protein
MKITLKHFAALPLALALTAATQEPAKTINNWRAEHSRDKINSTNVAIDAHRGLESTGTPAKAIWVRTFDKPGTYSFRIKYNPIAGRDMTFSLNGKDLPLKGLNAKPKSNDSMDCDADAQWRTLGDFTFVAGPNTLIATPVPADGKLPHICQFEAILQN